MFPQHILQLSEVSFRFCATCKTNFFLSSSRPVDREALLAHLRLFFSLVIVKDGVTHAVNREIDFGEIHSGAKVMRVLEFLLCAGAVFRKLEFDLSQQAKSVLQI